MVDPADVETLEDLVVAAVHDARRAAEEHRQRAPWARWPAAWTCSAMGCGRARLPGFGAPDSDDDGSTTTTTTTMKTMDDEDDEDRIVAEDDVIDRGDRRRAVADGRARVGAPSPAAPTGGV